MTPFKLRQTSLEVQEALDRILALTPGHLDSLGIYCGTTAHWNSSVGFIPEAGSIIIYTDYQTYEEEGKVVVVPGFKIGSGNGYVQDLAFLGQKDTEDLALHIADEVRHITSAERARWNNKINVNDSSEVVEETLLFNRN